jgi:uncharacterized protein
MENNNRVFLVSPRRFGKTCLLHYVKGTLEKDGIGCTYIDLNAFPDIRSFAGAITGIAARAMESNTDRLLKFLSGFQKLRHKLSMDSAGNVNAGEESEQAGLFNYCNCQ